ncbi:MAG TPA: hypothetical protein VLI94_08025 [Solirubrobacterales bacterium]|nr:hypothetical protein [Solirubrobacterales bacterium]
MQNARPVPLTDQVRFDRREFERLLLYPPDHVIVTGDVRVLESR